MTRWYIRRVRLNNQGYDRQGSYWGGGIPLWYVYDANGKFEFHIRGHKDYARCAYQWARRTSDVAGACRQLNANGGW